tara:strand:- start:345 stop:638 length:294 start_codon:yes stop_codon:yes gene_type:complete
MPLQYVPPEEAFEVRVQTWGLKIPVYHVYKDNRADYALAYWYTFDEAEDEDNEFDIRDLPNWSEHTHGTSFDVLLQDAFDRGLVRINNNQLITVGGE